MRGIESIWVARILSRLGRPHLKGCTWAEAWWRRREPWSKWEEEVPTGTEQPLQGWEPACGGRGASGRLHGWPERGWRWAAGGGGHEDASRVGLHRRREMSVAGIKAVTLERARQGHFRAKPIGFVDGLSGRVCRKGRSLEWFWPSGSQPGVNLPLWPHQGTHVMSGASFGCHSWGGVWLAMGISWVEVRGAAEDTQGSAQSPQQGVVWFRMLMMPRLKNPSLRCLA